MLSIVLSHLSTESETVLTAVEEEWHISSSSNPSNIINFIIILNYNRLPLQLSATLWQPEGYPTGHSNLNRFTDSFNANRFKLHAVTIDVCYHTASVAIRGKFGPITPICYCIGTLYAKFSPYSIRSDLQHTCVRVKGA